MTGFGPNEWLVDELYQAVPRRPERVDQAWWDFFADYQPADMTLPRAIARAGRRRRAGHRPAANGAATRRRPRRRPRPRRASGAERHRPAGSEPPAPSSRRPAPLTPEPTATAAPTLPSAAVTRARVRASAGSETSPLRGAGGPRRHQHGDLSLEVPTATSVRAVPAKLLIDNRIVINNHLARAPRRQGLLHPPHRLRPGQGARRRCRR